MGVIYERLKPYINEEYIKFVEKLNPDGKKSLGIKTPILKDIAKSLASENCIDIIKEECLYLEETITLGLMIGYIKDFKTAFKAFDMFIPHIDSWASCDQSIANFKAIKKHKNEYLSLIEKYRYSKNEYEVRAVLVSLLFHYCEYEYKDLILDVINTSYINTYYTRMACAWLICEMMIKMRDFTLSHINDFKVDAWTINKAISKMHDSYRISDEDKILLNNYKRK